MVTNVTSRRSMISVSDLASDDPLLPLSFDKIKARRSRARPNPVHGSSCASRLALTPTLDECSMWGGQYGGTSSPGRIALSNETALSCGE